MPSQLPSITADGVRCLRSQSTPNSRWFRAPRTVRPIVFDALDCSQQAVLLDERNNGTKEQVLKLEDEKSKKKTPAKPFSAVLWKKKFRKFTTTSIHRTDKTFEDLRTAHHSSIKPGSSSASRSLKHYVDTIPYTMSKLLKSSRNK